MIRDGRQTATEKHQMSNVKLNEKLFKAAVRRAADGGYANVEEYVADVISKDIAEDSEKYEHLFTAELLARLERITGEIKAGGKMFTLAEVRGLFAGRREA